MDGWLDLDTVAPGTPVFDAAGMPLGTVEATEGESLRVGGRAIPAAWIGRVDPAGIYLHAGPFPLEASSPTGLPASDTILGSGASAATADSDRMIIPLAEERAVVTERAQDLGEIIIIKRVIAEERMVPVTLRREVLELVRRDADGNETVEDFPRLGR